jgi:hypothetical protein
MKKVNHTNSDFEYELLSEDQQDIALRDKLIVLYSTPFADTLWWELRDISLMNQSFYKLYYYEQSVLKHIILFKYSTELPSKIVILNREIKISLKNIENICQILFCEFGKVKQIVFKELFKPDLILLPKGVFEKASNDVIILDLPKTMDAYMKSLGTSTRKKIKLMTNRIARDFPDTKVHYFEKSEILFDQIEKAVSLNRNRMKTKGIISQLNDTECKILHQYASTSDFGFLCIYTIKDNVVGATINSIIGEHAYMHVISHDNLYNQYSVGQIVLVNATKYLIEEKNIKYYHLLRGSQEYKFRHGGINHDLYTIRVFRKKDIYYFSGKIMGVFRNKYKNFKQRVQNDKRLYRIYVQLNKIKMFFCYENPVIR